MKRYVQMIMAFLLFLSLTGCARSSEGETITPLSKEENTAAAAVRPQLVSAEDLAFTANLNAAVPEYTVADDFSNVYDSERLDRLSEEVRNDLKKNYFAVSGQRGYEFFEVYEENMYSYHPNFITVDSLLHTYHLYYAFLQKNVEQRYLNDALQAMSEKLLAESQAQYEALKGSEWESAAKRNADYFAIAVTLSGGSAELSEAAQNEVTKIMNASDLGVSELFSTDQEYMQDYSQFKPRGYYTENENLERYFRTMMWYGQMNFTQREEELDRSALLASLAIDEAGKTEWETIYKVTAFLAGESDDNGYYEYLPVIKQAYGNEVKTADLLEKKDAFDTYHRLTGTLKTPEINSIVIGDETMEPDRDAATLGFRVMGQRFSIDASILQNLVYRSLKENEQKERRMMPDALDVPAALGSNEALNLLKEYSDISRYPDYETNLGAVKAAIEKDGDNLWTASVSAAWLNAMRPLLNENRSGYPVFMQNDAWKRKDLVSFLGNYTELKHDTVLYAKQTMAEMGADGAIEKDDRGYVEPEPEVFGRLAQLAKATVKGLDSYGMISAEDKEYMGILADLSDRMRVIAEKELRDELPTDEEFELIRTFGGQLEHLWMRTVETPGHNDRSLTMDYPACLVTDIATNPDGGTCLELATGLPSDIYVLINVDGVIKLASGSVYTFYQFEQPLSNRMTDEQWEEMTRNQMRRPSADYPALPEWTRDYSSDLFFHSIPIIGTGFVWADKINVRLEPSTESEIVGSVSKDEYLRFFEQKEAEGYTWYRIGEDRWVADSDGKWIYAYLD